MSPLDFSQIFTFCLVWSLYRIEVVNSSRHGHYIGCYKEHSGKELETLGRYFADFRHDFDDMTPKFCSELCFRRGFKYAGVQFGRECYCTNKELDMARKTVDEACQMPCPGDARKTCGGVLRLSVYATGLTAIESLPHGFHLGCFKENSGKDLETKGRLFSDFRHDFDNLVPKICIEMCFRKGFKLSGVQFKRECYCSNKALDLTRQTDEGTCDLPCSGDAKQKCGGVLRLSVFATGWTALDTLPRGFHLGCFRENSDAVHDSERIFPEYRQDLENLTPMLCIEVCSKNSYMFSGVQLGRECYCTDKHLDMSRQTDEKTCHTPCAGDKSKKCGGQWRLNVYATGNRQEKAVEESLTSGLHVGCFKENSGRELVTLGRYFPDFRQDFDDLTPKRCFELCFRRGFKLAGLQFGVECYCTNKKLDMNRKTVDSACQKPCPGDPNEKCGGPLRLSVYATGLTAIDSLPSGFHLGCFKENSGHELHTKGRFFSDFREDSDDLTPKLCQELCFKRGFKLSGVQFGRECYCSNKKLDITRQTDEDSCRMGCAGDPRQKCGGALRLNVYATGVTKATGENRGVEKLDAPVKQTVTTTPSSCVPGRTIIVNEKGPRRHRTACKNAVILYDDFEKIDLDRWQYDIKIASKPDYEFTVYDAKPENVFVKNGALHIQPTILSENFVENGKIDLKRCTGDTFNDECTRGTDFFILPPVQSARITTKQKFSFQYGLIEMQAKFPTGDWISADIRLVPVDYSYGPFYESGLVRIVSRGNSKLKTEDGQEIGGGTVEASAMLGYGASVKSKSVFYNDKANEFHNFTIVWTPDDIVFMVDGKQRQNMMANAPGLKLSDAIGFPSSEIKLWNTGTSIAPFDRSFHLSLGVSVGGIRDFEDGCDNNGKPKPWSNSDPRAMISFWNNRKEWQNTWNSNSAFVVKSIKIIAV